MFILDQKKILYNIELKKINNNNLLSSKKCIKINKIIIKVNKVNNIKLTYKNNNNNKDSKQNT